MEGSSLPKDFFEIFEAGIKRELCDSLRRSEGCSVARPSAKSLEDLFNS